MRDDNNDFRKIQNSADIVEIIRTYIELKNQGKNYFGVCPFHNDHSPSMSVSPDKQIYKCFVCGATGNVFTFVQNYLNISFLEAVKIIADKVGIDFKIRESGEDVKNKKYYDIMNLSSLLYQNNLRTKFGQTAREYLHKRGITDEIINEFSIGLALKENKMLYTLLEKKSISRKDMDELGLVAEGNTGVYDLFRNRIIFPLKSPTGKINGFSGRIYDSNSQSKYINTKETVIFKKRENLYNYHLAAPIAKKEKFIILCEGFMDAIRVYSCGIKNIVASMGTALAKEQIALLKKLNVKVVVVMDNDAPGEMATVSIGEELLKENIDVGIVRLTGKKDPDEYILEYGIEAFKDNIKHPISYLEFMENYLKKDKNLKNPVELSKYINDILGLLTNLNDELLTDITISKLATEFNLDRELLKNKVKNENEISEDFNIKISSLPDTEIKTSQKNTNKLNKAMMMLCYYMMNDVNAVRIFLRNNVILPKNKYRLVVNNLIYYYELNKEVDFADYLTFSENYEEVSSIVKEIISSITILEFSEDDIISVLELIKKILNDEKIRELKGKMKTCLDINHKKKLFEEIIEIKKGCVKNG